MGCKSSKVGVINGAVIQPVKSEHKFSDNVDSTIEDTSVAQTNISQDYAIINKLIGAHNHTEIQVADPQAFNDRFVQQRQQAIDERSYRLTIESWKPQSLQQLVETIKTFSKGKSLVDRHWIIFYWVTSNIKYDTVSYFSKDYKDQSAEGVFRTKMGVCAGYANIYKYLCDHLQIPCEKVSGYSKGYGFDSREGAPTETDHAWNAVEIDHHWYLMESTWGAGHLNEQEMFIRQLSSYYFLPRPSEMIYHHLPEDDKWQLLQTPIKMAQSMQMPKLKPLYFELNLELISPRNQAHVDLLPKKPYALVLIRAPSNVHLTATLELKDQKIDGGHRVIYDKQKQIFFCYFAPVNIGKHKITIFGRQGDTEDGTHSSVLGLTLDVKQSPSPCVSYPYTSSLFYDLGLKIEAPQNRSNAVWSDNASFAEVLIKAPDDVQLSCRIEYDNIEVENGSLAQFDNDKNLWQLLFAPERTGPHELIVFAKGNSEENSGCVLKFNLDVTKLRQPMKFPTVYSSFHNNKCQLYTPMDGILKKGSVIPFHCVIPGAKEVNLTVDSKWLESEGYTDPILQRYVSVGSKEVTIYAKYGEKPSYVGLVKYTVQ